MAALPLAGLVFLFAHVFRSPGSVRAPVLVLVRDFAFFWGAISLLNSYGSTGSSDHYIVMLYQLRLGWVSPVQLGDLMFGLESRSGTLGGVGSGYLLAGITLAWTAAISALWPAGTVAGAYYLAPASD